MFDAVLHSRKSFALRTFALKEKEYEQVRGRITPRCFSTKFPAVHSLYTPAPAFPLERNAPRSAW
jgi:hypothetical protein